VIRPPRAGSRGDGPSAAPSLVEAQEPKAAPAPTGVVFNTSMSRPGAALALAALYVMASRREARVNGVCVTGAGLTAAIFCDVVGRFYGGQARVPSSNTVLPIGYAPDPRLPEPAMVGSALSRTRADGTPQYARSIQRVSDTAAPDAMLRNAITFSPECVVVLSAPATWLVKSLELAGTASQYKQRVKRVVLVEGGGLGADRAALERLRQLVAVPLVTVPADLARQLSVAAADIASRLSWAPAHPVADAVRDASGATVTLDDVAAVHYAVHPDSGFYTVEDGRLRVTTGQAAECVSALAALSGSKPAPPPARGG
jgi:hypothetical protein